MPFELSVDLTTLAILALVAFIAGFIDAIAGGGVAAFGSVVVFTMLASLSFDPRLIWDEADPEAEHQEQQEKDIND